MKVEYNAEGGVTITLNEQETHDLTLEIALADTTATPSIVKYHWPRYGVGGILHKVHTDVHRTLDNATR